MAFADLREFIAHLDKRGQLRRVTVPVSRDLEIAEITDRVSKSSGGRNVALLFENVRGFDMPVLINAFGVCRAHGGRARRRAHRRPRRTRGEAARPQDARLLLRQAEEARRRSSISPRPGPSTSAPRRVRRWWRRDHPSLATLPIIQCWPGDAGRYITLPMVFTRDPDSGARNVGMYRLQVFDDQTLGMHWQTHKGSAEHHRVAEETKQPMEVAIALGGDPCSIYAASAPLPPGVDEMVFAGWLRGSGVPMVTRQDRRPGRSRRGRDRARGLGRSARSAGSRARSAITPATTRWRATTRSSTCARSRGGAIPSTPRRSSDGRRRRTTGSARRRSGSSCRSSGCSCRRSWT